MCKQTGLFFFISAVLLLLGACGVRNPSENRDSMPWILAIRTPDRVSLSTPAVHTIDVRVEDPQGPQDIGSVLFTLSDTLDALPMSDLGRDGDILPFDGVFSGQFSGSLFTAPGDYRLAVLVEDISGNRVTAFSDTIHVLEMRLDEPPVLLDPVVADTLQPGDLEAFHFSIRANHARGPEAIDSLVFRIYPPLSPMPLFQGKMRDDGTGGDETAGDGLFSITIDLSDTLTSVGLHQIRFQAWDTDGGMSLPVITKFIMTGEGDSPVLSGLNAPAEVNRLDPAPFVITIRVRDKQGLSDIKRVYFNSVKPDGMPAGGNPFILLDDGGQASGDHEAGDGIYSIMISITVQNTLGQYTFTFYAEDHESHVSEPLVHELTVIQGGIE